MYQARSEALGVAGGLGGSRQRSAGSRASGDDAETAKGTNRGDAWVQVSATGSSGFPTRDKSASEEARRQELIETAEAVGVVLIGAHSRQLDALSTTLLKRHDS